MKSFAVLIAIGWIAASTPALATEAGDLCSGDPCTISGTHTIDAGSVLDFGGAAVILSGSAKLTIGPASEAGLVTRPARFNAGSFDVQAGAELDGDGSLSDFTFDASAGDISFAAGSEIDVSDNAAGALNLIATGNVNFAGTYKGSAGGLDSQGGIFSVTAGAAATISGPISANASGSGGAGGEISIYADGDINFSSEVTTKGSDFGGGPFELNSTNGSILFTGDLEASGGNPDGEAGSVDMIAANGSVDIQGSINGKGGAGPEESCGDGSPLTVQAGGNIDLRSGDLTLVGGKHCFGGETDFTTTTNFTMHPASSMTLTAGGAYGGGGGFTVSATGNAIIRDVELTSPGGGGFVEIISGSSVNVLGELDAQGTSGDGLGGNILVQACNVSIDAGAELDARAGFAYPGLGINELRASGQMTIAGIVRAEYENIFQYKTSPPVVSGSASISPVPTVVENLELPDCASACGDGVIDEGEVCDDGNLLGCDGCSSDCSRVDNVCGDGLSECTELCDDGNAVNGDGCESTCVPSDFAGVRISGTRERKGCLVEWDTQLANARINPYTGRADNKQECTDGDPRCDADDEINGVCSFDLAACVAVDNPDMPACDSGNIEFLRIRAPRVDYGANLTNLANADRLAAALMGLGGTVKSGTNTLQTGPTLTTAGQCTERFVFEVPYGRTGKTTSPISVGARDDAGHLLVGNKVGFTCLRNDAVCGNGELEIGEQCDDNNRDACDGCSSTCRIEACGNGILECGEQCDEGDANGTDASRCSDTCSITPPDLRIPGGGSGKTDCAAEWSVETAPSDVVIAKNGLPKPIAFCRAGDPSCDFDLETPGCQFRVWGCFGAADSRISCSAQGVRDFDLRRPTARSRKTTDLEARATLLRGIGSLDLAAISGETCTPAMLVDVPSGERLRMSARTFIAGAKLRDGDRLKLQCLK